MQDSVLGQGVDLLLYGMGTVFIFLTLLVIVTRLMGRIIIKYFPEPEPEIISKAPLRQNAQAKPASVNKTTLAVIQDAIYQHRAKQ